MFIYNVTTLVQYNIHHQWVEWMQQQHIPDVMATECFSKFQFVRVLETDETEGVTYAVQYFAESKALYNRYIEHHAATLRKEVVDKWGNQIVGFRSLMQVVN
ncbi:MAG: DUF4286 domain-containing protein [Chitinophaga sp.]|jgi:Domain of unknown function (DUF4286)|nr:DUF4286 domain-containing protein [Chitinophaga sp.]